MARSASGLQAGVSILAPALALVWIGIGAAHADGRQTWLGRPLVEVLQELRRGGLEIVFSSAVVPDDLEVTVEPTASDPRGMLAQILPPLGLEARPGPGGSLLIVPRKRAADAIDERPPPRRIDFSTALVVIPGRHHVLREDPGAGRAIDRDELPLVPNIGGDFSRVIERVPGVAAPDNSAAFHARGSLAEDASLVFDGLELYDPYHLQSFFSPFSLVDNELVDRAEFLGGGFTVDYGDRHGAFVDISTVTADAAHGELELGTLNSRFSYRAPIAEGTGSWLLSVRGWYPEALQETIKLGGGPRLRPRLGDAYAKLTWTVSPRTVVSVHGLFAYDQLDFAETTEGDNEEARALTRSDYLWARTVNRWTDRLSGDTVMSAGRIDRSRDGIAAPDSGLVTVIDEREVEFLGLTHDLEWQVAETQLVRAGLYARYLWGDYRYENLGEDDSSSLTLEPEGASFGLYAAWRAQPARRLVTELGVRWDRQGYTDDSQFSPRFNLLWRVGERTELRGSIGRFQQSQRIHELHVEDGQTEFLPAEASEALELTLLRRLPAALRMRVDAYARRLSDVRPRFENLFQPRDLFPETADDRVIVAPEEARLRGIEVLVGNDDAGPLDWWISYGWSVAEDLLDEGWQSRSWDQTHTGKLLVGRRWGERWFASLSGTLHTGWPTTPVSATSTTLPDGSIEFEPVIGERNADRFPTYGRLDAKLRRSFALGRGRLSLTLEVINLTDRQNPCCVDDLLFEPREDGTVEVQREFSYWLGRTPSFSVRWEF